MISSARALMRSRLKGVLFLALFSTSIPSARADFPLPQSIGALGDSGTAGVLAGLERSKMWNPLYHAKIGLSFLPMLWSGGKVSALTWGQLSWSTGLDRSGRVNSLAMRLKQYSPGLKSINVALPSVKTPELYSRELPELRAWSQHELHQNWPDLVTLFIGANDICADSLAEMTSVDEYTRTMRAILQEIFQESPRTRVILLPLPRFDLFYENNRNAWAVGYLGGPWVGKCGDIWKIAPMCKTLTQLLPSDAAAKKIILSRIQSFNEVLADLAQQWGDRVLFVDEIQSLQIKPEHLSIDCFHPNYRLHGQVAEMVWHKLYTHLPLAQ